MSTPSPVKKESPQYQSSMIDTDKNFPPTGRQVQNTSPLQDMRPPSLSNSKVLVNDSRTHRPLGSKKNSVAPLEKYALPQSLVRTENEMQAKPDTDLEKGVIKNESLTIMRNSVGNGSQSQIMDLKDKDASQSLFIKEGKEMKTPTEKEKDEPRRSGLETFGVMDGFCIKQKFEVFQEGKTWESSHRTYVHRYDPAEEKVGKKAFQCNESSGWCAKQCLSNYCRPFKVVINTSNSAEGVHDYRPFLQIERTCTCTCLMFNRPQIIVKLIEDGKDEYLGKIQDCFNFGSIKLNVYDKENILKYVIDGDCCQWGLMCNCYCQACQTVDFLVRPQGGDCTRLRKKSTQTATVPYPNADRFTLDFSPSMLPEDKALLLSAVLFLDSRYFEGDP